MEISCDNIPPRQPTQPQEGPYPRTSHDPQSQAPQSIRHPPGIPLSHPCSSSQQDKRSMSIRAILSLEEERAPKGTPKTVDRLSIPLAPAELPPTFERPSPNPYLPHYNPTDVRPSRPENGNRPPSKLPSPLYSESWERNSASSRHSLPTPPDTPRGFAPQTSFHRVVSPLNQIPTPPPTPQRFVPSTSPTIPFTPRPLYASSYSNPPPSVVRTPHVTSVSPHPGPAFDSARTEKRLSPVIEDVGHQPRQQDHLPKESLARHRRSVPPDPYPLSVSSDHSPLRTATNTNIPSQSIPIPEKHQISNEPTPKKLVQLSPNILASEPDRKAGLCLRGDDAKLFRKRLHTVLEHGDNDFRRQAHLLLLDHCATSFDIVPSALVINGVALECTHPIGGGASADIYLAVYNGKEVALKRPRIFRGQKLLGVYKAFCREASVWKRLNHPFVLPFYGLDAETFSPYLSMVSPYMHEGTILEHLARNGHVNVEKLLLEVAQGLEYLHSENVVHGDLRGSNIFIDDNWHVRLADYGLSVNSDMTVIFTSTGRGSPRWMAPELLSPEQPEQSGLQRTKASDVHAFACTSWEIFTGRAPFYQIRNDAAVSIRILNGERPERPSPNSAGPMSGQLWSLVQRCWSNDPIDRPSIGWVVESMKQH